MDDYNDTWLGWDSPSPDTCIPIPRHNATIITDVYSGIPENLLLNTIGFMILVLIFGLLRKRAWNYGRLALLQKSDNRWTELFYGDNDGREIDVVSVEASVNSQLSHVDRGFLSWIVTAFRITDEELLRRAGPDGLLYVSFERYLIMLTALMTAAALCIALPINFHGNFLSNGTRFGHTTLSNIDPNSDWVWVHSLLILSYLPIGCIIMRRFTKQVRDARPAGELAARTLLITDIPKHQCNVEALTQYFREAFPTLTVEDVTLAHDIKRLTELDLQRDCAEQARLYCENYAKQRPPLKMYPYPCGEVLGCCCHTVDAQDFYALEEFKLTALVDEERKAALARPLGMAFVTLGTPGAARSMKRQLRVSPTIKWSVNYAPAPSDIFWENLSIARPCWYLNAILINLILGAILFFLTTPAVIVSALNKIPITGEISNLSPIVSSFLPTVMLVSVAAVMPALVGKSEALVKHWTRSGLNRAVMRKTLLLLLLMVLILPSLGLTSAQALLSWTVNAGNGTSNRWECVFLPDQGALFVNYVVTAALVGCGLELVRFPELALYTFRLCIARSRAERVAVRRAVLWEFPLGAHYAWLLLVFTMTTVYSVACPLITPFGLLYLCVKHLVDRHNLSFAYGPSVGGGRLAGAAASAAGAAPILAQTTLLALGLVRRGSSPLAAVQLIGLVISILGLVTGASLPTSKSKMQTPRGDLGTAQSFIPPVLRVKPISNSPVETGVQNSTATLSSEIVDDLSNVPVDPNMVVMQESPRLYQDYGREPRV
ncbi:calcium permeable stress-gated cation channel 1 isoform X1 [Neodiprion virginianus]|uniref:calcium permeable stress-gated cation channel 1 isoform X1 n=1 Tax=Neodiprion fabricii TaxID=2872261 RepID=UPI001ED95740|nr:calcium permeable stress-gated cation channel 1 isoform X1 [Neodiprion fabricii]XP_046607433.1 calcium permeable stress-gated cation channel 1 isoform X1 [Neodiprion virginianus]